LRNPQFLIGCCVFWLPFSQPPICTGDQPFSLAFRPAATCAACRSPALPSNSTSNSHRLLDSPVGGHSISSLRLRPTVLLNLLADPSTRVFVSALSLAFRPRLRLAPPAVPPACLSICFKARALWPIVQLRFPADLQLAPSTDPPALLSNLTSDSHRLLHPSASPWCQPSACASGQPSGCAFQPASSLRLPPTFQLCLRTCLRLAPPAVPGSAFVPISSLRLQSTFRPTVA